MPCNPLPNPTIFKIKKKRSYMEEINGIIIINKPKGYTSHDVVAKVKKILDIKKVGHTGTLDPNATGVLPLLLNQGTKLSKYLINHDKEYEVVLKLGIKTDTLDGEGNKIEERVVDWNKLQDVEKVLQSLKGKQKQIPPMYSAIKVKGKKLYEYARNGQTVEIAPREIEIYHIELQAIDKEKNEILFKVECSKGTYIRSLCEEIAKRLGTIGYMKELNRTKVGDFSLKNAITLEELEKNKKSIENGIITMETLFSKLPRINLLKEEIQKFLNGVTIAVKEKDGLYNIYAENYIGLGVVKNKEVKRDIIN